MLSSINIAELYICCIYSGFRVKFMKIRDSRHFLSFFISVPFLIFCFNLAFDILGLD